MRFEVPPHMDQLPVAAQISLQGAGGQQEVDLLSVGALGPQHPFLQVAVVQPPGHLVTTGQ